MNNTQRERVSTGKLLIFHSAQSPPHLPPPSFVSSGSTDARTTYQVGTDRETRQRLALLPDADRSVSVHSGLEPALTQCQKPVKSGMFIHIFNLIRCCYLENERNVRKTRGFITDFTKLSTNHQRLTPCCCYVFFTLFPRLCTSQSVHLSFLSDCTVTFSFSVLQVLKTWRNRSI